MASPSSATHGKFAHIWHVGSSGFVGTGINDLAWGTAFNGDDSAEFEVVIDSTGTPDTFKWRQNGGSWTESVDITGLAQTLDDGQTITFAATTGHTIDDQWAYGNLKDEPCTENGVTAQITDTGLRILNPNTRPVFTDSGGKTVAEISYTDGIAIFGDTVTAVTVTGNGGYIPTAAIKKVGYLVSWSMDFSRAMADTSSTDTDWTTALPGMLSATGSAEKFFIGVNSFFENLLEQKYSFLQLFSYDPDKDRTGDHFSCWATITGFGTNPAIGDAVKETISFQVEGVPAFTANV
jgi:hypothetical protein